MQRLLSNAVWDEDGVRDELRKSVLERLGAEHAIAAIDETSFPKRGDRSAGVAPHSCGSTKPVENCQVGVFLSYISPLGHTLLDRELYLPRHWVEDRARCEEASIPETVRFQTKCELARRMVDSSFSQCKSRAGLVMVASMPTSQSRRLSCQAPPQLQLVVCHARSSKTKRGLEVRVAARGLARQKCNAVCSRVLVASTPSLDVSLSSLQSP